MSSKTRTHYQPQIQKEMFQNDCDFAGEVVWSANSVPDVWSLADLRRTSKKTDDEMCRVNERKLSGMQKDWATTQTSWEQTECSGCFCASVGRVIQRIQRPVTLCHASSWDCVSTEPEFAKRMSRGPKVTLQVIMKPLEQFLKRFTWTPGDTRRVSCKLTVMHARLSDGNFPRSLLFGGVVRGWKYSSGELLRTHDCHDRFRRCTRAASSRCRR